MSGQALSLVFCPPTFPLHNTQRRRTLFRGNTNLGKKSYWKLAGAAPAAGLKNIRVYFPKLKIINKMNEKANYTYSNTIFCTLITKPDNLIRYRPKGIFTIKKITN